VSAVTTMAVNLLDPHSLLAAFRPVGVGAVMFAETGLLIGFFRPGDSLLFTAGILSAAPVRAPQVAGGLVGTLGVEVLRGRRA